MSDVTVVIPFYNPGLYLIDAVKSVFNQTYEDWKMILVDDCSTDNSILGVKSYLDDPRITLIKNKENLGQSNSLNIGLSAVETPFMIQLDGDDWLCESALELLMKEASSLPDDVAVISGNIRIFNENNAQKQIIKKGRLFKNRYDFLLSNLSVWPRFYRTSALNYVGGWPTDDPFDGRFNEDKRILLRLIEHFRFHWIDNVLYVHRIHNTNQTKDLLSYETITKWTVRNALKRWGDQYEPVFIKSGGWVILKKLIPKQK
ncbi:glycosyltransferase family 2 protein [Guptibacillus sedimenti]|uniref:glycosyltransferase family 2 protein n=1 Tax=Guptibacillus sedimenti TaxID=3025680 RepID=UPI00235F1ED4|nr:glycosyltransferase family 2 protein [Pseudalkalibacillus sedimenti]